MPAITTFLAPIIDTLILLIGFIHALLRPIGEWFNVSVLGAWEESIKVDVGDRTLESLAYLALQQIKTLIYTFFTTYCSPLCVNGFQQALGWQTQLLRCLPRFSPVVATAGNSTMNPALISPRPPRHTNPINLHLNRNKTVTMRFRHSLAGPGGRQNKAAQRCGAVGGITGSAAPSMPC